MIYEGGSKTENDEKDKYIDTDIKMLEQMASMSSEDKFHNHLEDDNEGNTSISKKKKK